MQLCVHTFASAVHYTLASEQDLEILEELFEEEFVVRSLERRGE